MEIDWSKAPEGATHWGHDTDRHCESWYEVTDGEIVRYLPADYALQPMLPAVAGSAYYHLVDDLVGRPAPWSGEGLPPVGTMCEFAGGTHCPDDPFDRDLKEGMQVRIIAHFKDGDLELAAFTFNPGNHNRGRAVVEQGAYGCFRPIRTPEQIAEEERELAIKDMAWLTNWPAAASTISVCASLYDAGYRLPAKP